MRDDPAELLNEAQWLRRLAQRLARDGATAEDLLQELRLHAWQRAPADPARRGPWLVRVLTNLARKERRGAARRSSREQRCAAPEPAPGADELAERIEAQRLLLAELAALDEPFRSALVLRYQDELEPSAIARRLGLPPGTVRWRLHEGLARLRERLDRRHGGRREEWVLACAPLFPRAGRALPFNPSTWPLWLGLGMNTSLKLGLAAAGLGLIALPVWLSLRAAPERAPALHEGAAPAPVAELRSPPSALAPVPEARAPRAESAPAEAPPRAAQTAAAPHVARVEGRVLDASRRARADGVVEAGAEPGAVRAACDGAGDFALELADVPPGEFELRIQAPGCASRVLAVVVRPGERVLVGEIVLAAGARVSGWVREASGAAASGVRVCVARPRPDGGTEEMRGPLLAPESAWATSDAQGRFVVEGAPVGVVRAWARRPEAVLGDADERSDWVRSAAFELAPLGSRDDLELVLPGRAPASPTAIAGVVRTPDGAPLAFAQVRVDARAADGSFQERLTADAAGRFVYDAKQAVRAELVASDGEERWRAVRQTDVQSGTTDVELMLQEARWLELSVRGAGGAPVDEFELKELRVLADGSRGWPRALAGHAGRARLLLPLDPFVLAVAAAGHAASELGPFEPESAPAELACTLQALPGLRGRVTHAGAPVAGATLELLRYAAADEHVETHGFPQRLWYEVEERATSDADGRFLLTGRQAGERALLCTAAGFALAELGPLQVEPRRGRDGLALELARGGTLVGQVRTASGVDPAGLIVGANRFDGHPRTQRTDEHGRFRFDGLTPGEWRLERVKREVDPGDDNFLLDSGRTAEDPRLAPNCSVRDGETTEFVLDLSAEAPARLSARVVVNGAPAAGWALLLWPVGVSSIHGELPGGVLDERGEVSVELEPGRYFVRFKHGAEFDFNGVAEAERELPAGASALAFAFETAALAGRCAGDPRGLVLSWKARTPDGLGSQALLPVDADGRFAREVVLAGAGELTLLRRDDAGHATELGKKALVLRAGERVELEFP